MRPTTPEIKVKDLDHCGIIAGIIDEIGLVTQIDQIVSKHGNQKVTRGQAVKAMIINNLGMISSFLYLLGKFFEGKPNTSPTLQWIFQCFMSVHLISFGGVKQISNLTSERSYILQFFSPSCRQYYLLD
jgi:hypothetical protein